ncbi:MAG: VOC family protein [Anaerolineales bacterium]
MNLQNEPFRIHPETGLAHLELTVHDLPNMLAFYGDLMGFKVIENLGGRAKLSSTGGQPTLLTLSERKDAQPQPAHSVGLYHTAFRFSGRKPLATSLMRLVAARWPLQGASDHRVSEAIYLADPEGNGIEIYRDRPREDWPRMQDSIQMGNMPLDLQKLLEEADQDAAQTGAIDPGTDLGHIHLQVSELDKADAFYHHLLGLDIMMSLPTALFMSAGGYHHHLGANTWHSLHAPRRKEGMQGLRSFALQIPDEANWLALARRIQATGQEVGSVELDDLLGLSVADQDGIRIELLTAATTAVRQVLDSLRSATLA